ncbi:MAG: tRNA-guanine transglycosylase DpdA [Candidatus Nitrosotenuis sp.]
MEYFLPDWEDRLDPNYNFETDTFSRDRSAAYATDVYAHQIFKKPPYDGILISLAVFKDKINLMSDGNGGKQIRNFKSIKDYLRIERSSELKVMGDCGAFSYINEDFPPEDYRIDKVSDIYQALKFDYGVSVDHMIPDSVMRKKGNKIRKINITEKQKEERRQLTLKNAKEFIKYHRKKNLDFVPIGAVQGYCPETYADSAAKTIEMGYSYIGIGTLVPKSDDEIVEILKAVKIAIGKKKIKIHLFGILRPRKIEEFKSLGVSSFDSASFLRKAWLRAGRNYIAKNGNWYAAIRIPYSENSVLIKNALKEGYSVEDIKHMEKMALKVVRDYASKKTEDVEKVLKTVLKYDMLLLREHDGNHHYDKYKKTLIDRPWERCNCEICKEIGVDVIIFRGANRNKRRGFHNIKVFYDRFLSDNSK